MYVFSFLFSLAQSCRADPLLGSSLKALAPHLVFLTRCLYHLPLRMIPIIILSTMIQYIIHICILNVLTHLSIFVFFFAPKCSSVVKATLYFADTKPSSPLVLLW
ncbi:hypothetical protein EDD17DRAFT_206611 [Pisolithus thermaeus]|nr:hypothetical protein EDD17DRAFT_206611 [Pisolithus thermaeus]